MKKYILIGIGGMLGAAARYLAEGIGQIGDYSDFPFNTFVINISGCFILALILTMAFEIWEMDPAVRLGIATGFIGAFTTFSALCRETADLISSGHFMTAAVYIAGSAVAGLAAVWIGTALAHIMIRQLSEGVAADD